MIERELCETAPEVCCLTLRSDYGDKGPFCGTHAQLQSWGHDGKFKILIPKIRVEKWYFSLYFLRIKSVAYIFTLNRIRMDSLSFYI